MNIDTNKIMEVLTELATKLGVAVEHLWGVIVKQQLATGISNIVIATIYVISIFLIIKYSPKITKHFHDKGNMLKNARIKDGKGGYRGEPSISTMEEDYSYTAANSSTVCSVIIVVILIFFTINRIELGLKMTLNPEYYAFQDILQLLGR